MYTVVLSASPWGYSPFLLGCIYKLWAELLWFLFLPAQLVFCAVLLTFTIRVTFPSQGRCNAISLFSQMSHNTLCQNTNNQAKEGSVEPNHLQRLSEWWINNGNYFKTNWKQKAQPSSATKRKATKRRNCRSLSWVLLYLPLGKYFSTFLALQSQVKKKKS